MRRFYYPKHRLPLFAEKIQKIIRPLLLLCLIFYSVLVTTAQYKFETWTTEQGLPYKTVNSVLQTGDGYIWSATGDGLARFDGVRFTVFNTGNTKNLPTNRLHHLVETSDGSLWMAGENRGLIRYQNGVFEGYTTDEGLPGNQILHLVFVPPENLLRVITNKGIARFDGKKFAAEDFVPLPFDEKNPTQLDNTGAVLIRQNDKIYRFTDGAAAEVFQIPKSLAHFPFHAPYKDRAGNLWLAATTGGENQGYVLRFRDDTADVFSAKDGLPDGFTNAIFEDTKGNVWFGGRNGGGLSVYADGKFRLLRTKNELSSDGFHGFTEDREGGVWAAMDGGGLMRFSRQTINTLSAADGLTSENIYPILEDRGGTVWVGGWLGKGLDKYENGKFSTVKTPGSLFTSLFEDRDGAVWVGFFHQVGKIEDGKFSIVADDPVGAVIRAIAQDGDGAFWFGTESGGLRQYNPSEFQSLKSAIQNPKSNNLFTTRDGLPSDEVLALHFDRNGTLWVGTTGGLARFENGRFTAFTEAEGLSGNYIRSIYEDADGVLWIGTFDNGITRLKDGRLTAIRVRDGLFDAGAFQILEDDFGRFWISSNRGIYRVARQELNDFADGKTESVTSVAYGVRDGMLDAECNGGVQPAGFKSKRDGRLWFPTQKGVVVIDPKALPASNQPPNIVIEEILIDRKTVKLSEPPAVTGGQPDCGLRIADCGLTVGETTNPKSQIPNAQSNDTLEILPENDSLEINYTGLSFVKPEQIKFKYKLEGLDENWVDAGTRRTAYFAHLPPGDYTFRVIAANVDGVWNEAGATLKISVEPPFYRTFWFLSACVIVGFGLVAAIFNSRIRNLEKARAAQEEFSRRLLASQESERQRIASELHDSLGQELLIIKNWALLGLQNGKGASEQLGEISETASAAIDEVREIAYNLRPYHLDELGLSKAIESMCGRVSHSSGIDFNCSIDRLDDFFPKDAEINFYRIVQECVNNVVKHSGATEASISIRRSDGSLRLSVLDNGKGFDADSLSLKRAGQSGFGLAGISERARILGGKLAVNSSLNEGTIVNLSVNKKSSGSPSD